MTAIRARSACTAVMSTLVACLAVQPTLLRAQSNPTAPAAMYSEEQGVAQPPKRTAVQRALESMYRKEGRPLPQYMENPSVSPPVNVAASAEEAPNASAVVQASEGAPYQSQADSDGPSIFRRPFTRWNNAQQQCESYGG